MTAAAVPEVIVVRLAGGRYAVPMDRVVEVGRPPALTRVPGLPDWVLGLANWRGRVLAVLDLAELLAGPSTPPRPGSRPPGRLLVLTDGSTRVGLLTDGVDGSVRLDRPPSPAPPLPEPAAALVSGQVQDACGVLALLSVAAVFALSGRLPRQRRLD